jgi:hypothetical protein
MGGHSSQTFSRLRHILDENGLPFEALAKNGGV